MTLHPVRPAGHEVAELLDDPAVLRRVDPPDARRRALVDVAEQTRPADLPMAFEDAGAAGPRGEDAQQQVERLSDGPGVRVRAEVPDDLALGPAHDHEPRILLIQGDGEERVRLVVAVPDVETGVVLLDPRVLELEGLHLGGDGHPVDGGRGGDHLRRSGVQGPWIREVRVDPAAQALRLSDVDHPTVAVTEAVHAGLLGNRARSGPEAGRRPYHACERIPHRGRFPPARDRPRGRGGAAAVGLRVIGAMTSRTPLTGTRDAGTAILCDGCAALGLRAVRPGRPRPVTPE